MKWSIGKCSINQTGNDGEALHPAQIEALISECRAWAIHFIKADEDPEENVKASYGITHLPTGLAIINSQSLMYLDRYCKRMNELGDWYKPFEQLESYKNAAGKWVSSSVSEDYLAMEKAHQQVQYELKAANANQTATSATPEAK